MIGCKNRETGRQILIKHNKQTDCAKSTVWALIGSQKVVCNLKELISELEKPLYSAAQVESRLPNEHVHPKSRSDVDVIVFGDFASVEFGNFHNALIVKAEEGELNYLLRHFALPTNEKIRLQGYGAKMLIKSQEYKAVDDSSVSKGSFVFPSIFI